jgi:hypothetical protein
MLLRRKIECCWVAKKISKKRNIVIVEKELGKKMKK